MSQKHSSSKFATKLKFIIINLKVKKIIVCFRNLKTKCEKCAMECLHNEKISNTDINKLHWRFNNLHLVITNWNFFCMLIKYMSKNNWEEHAQTITVRKSF